MRGHNICFHCEIRKIIFKLSLIPPLIWSSAVYQIVPVLAKTLTFYDISVITEDIYSKLILVVYYYKGNPYQ